MHLPLLRRTALQEAFLVQQLKIINIVGLEGEDLVSFVVLVHPSVHPTPLLPLFEGNAVLLLVLEQIARLCDVPDVEHQQEDQEGREEEHVLEVVGRVDRRPEPALLVFHHLGLLVLEDEIEYFSVFGIILGDREGLVGEHALFQVVLAILNRPDFAEVVDRGFLDVDQEFVSEHN